jgi:uncharacterized protein YdhG (YjbR/CyaY superfamily)
VGALRRSKEGRREAWGYCSASGGVKQSPFGVNSMVASFMAKTDYQNIDAYHAAFAGETLVRLQTIREIVHRVAPHAEEVISYQIPAFKIGKHFLIYYSAFAKHISLASPWGETFLAHFAADLNGYKVSKSVIQLPNSQDLPTDLIERIVRFRLEQQAKK